MTTLAYLTGNTRYRRTWLGKLVLQVEFTERHAAVFGFDAWTTIGWRDAQIEDFAPPGAPARQTWVSVGVVPGQRPYTNNPPAPQAEETP